MKRLIAALLFAMLASVQVHAEEKPPLDIRLTARIDVGADGELRTLVWEDKGLPLAKMLTQRIEPLVRQWEFAPGTVDGVAADTRSYLAVSLRAQVREDDSVALRVINAGTGLRVARIVRPPYPFNAASNNIGAVAVAIVDLDVQGVASVRSIDVSGRKRDRAQFDDAVRKAISKLEVELEQVNGVPVAGSVRIPFVFCMSKDCTKEHKLSEAMTAGNGEFPVPLGSVARVLTNVEGLEIEG